MRSGVGLLIDHVVRVKLSGSVQKKGVLGAGAVLRWRTRTLIRSITSSPRYSVTEDRALAIIGTHLDYGRWHEEGYSGPEVRPKHRVRAHRVEAHSVRSHGVREHIRRVRTNSFFTGLGGRQVRVRAHQVRGHVVKAHRVRAHDVREHIAMVNIRAKHYLRDTLREKSPEAFVRLRRALIFLKRTGRVPSQSDLIHHGGSS